MTHVKILDEKELDKIIKIRAQAEVEGEVYTESFNFKKRRVRNGAYKKNLKSWISDIKEDKQAEYESVKGEEFEL